MQRMCYKDFPPLCPHKNPAQIQCPYHCRPQIRLQKFPQGNPDLHLLHSRLPEATLSQHLLFSQTPLREPVIILIAQVLPQGLRSKHGADGSKAPALCLLSTDGCQVKSRVP